MMGNLYPASRQSGRSHAALRFRGGGAEMVSRSSPVVNTNGRSPT
jgi:hypothetical protein